MKKQQAVKVLESFIRTEVRKNLREGTTELDLQDAKLALQMVNHLSAVSVRHNTNDVVLKQFEEEIASIRIQIMKYVEENSKFSFYGKSPNGFKLIKK